MAVLAAVGLAYRGTAAAPLLDLRAGASYVHCMLETRLP